VQEREKDGQVLDKLLLWASQRDDVRAMLLTSSRASPNARVDPFSDFDIILVVRDIHPYLDDETWLGYFGKVLVLYRDPIRLEHGSERFCRVTQYEDGTKIDFTVWPLDVLPRITELPKLPDCLDIGYRVLLDKDNLAGALKPATYSAHIPAIPTEGEFLIRVEHFLSNAPYVAKHLCRGDLIPMKYVFDLMKIEGLLAMLEWRMEIDHNWSIKPGAYGKGLREYVNAETWASLERTYVGAGVEENWEALFETISVFRTVAMEVGDRLGYSYPMDMDNRVVTYLHRVRNMGGGSPPDPKIGHPDEAIP
jgi:aminoglycoside 6-adenylyltransferase